MATLARLLPPHSATPLELSLAEANDPWATLADIFNSIPDLDANPPPGLLPFLVWEYGLGELSPYLPNLYDLISDGVRWQRMRGTPAAITKALGWLGLSGTLEEEPPRRVRWNRFQLGLGSLPAADYPMLDRIEGVVSLSPPIRSNFGRGYRGWDVRTCEASYQRFSASEYSDHSGIRLPTGTVQWSFGRETAIAYELTHDELVALDCWEAPSTSPVLWASDHTLWTSETHVWWDGYAQARRTAIVAALTENPCYVTFRDSGGAIVGYSLAICRGVNVDGSGVYMVGSTSYSPNAAPAKAIVITRTPFGAADTSVIASVDLAFNPVLASGVKPGLLWQPPAAITSAVHVAPSSVSLTMAATIREHVTFVLDLDTH